MLRYAMMLLLAALFAVPAVAQSPAPPSREALIAAVTARNGATFDDLGLDAAGLAAWVDRMLADEAALADMAPEAAASRESFETRLRLAETYYNLGFPEQFHRHLAAIDALARPLGPAGVSRLGRTALWRANETSANGMLPADASALAAELGAACTVGDSQVADVRAIAIGLDSLGGIYAERGNPVGAEQMLAVSLACFTALGLDASVMIHVGQLTAARLDHDRDVRAYADLLPGLRTIARQFDETATIGFDVERGGAHRGGTLAHWGGLFLEAAWRLHSDAAGPAGNSDLGTADWSNDVFDMAQRIYDTPASAALRRRAARDLARYERNDAALALIEEQADLIAMDRIARSRWQAPRPVAPVDGGAVVNTAAPQFWEQGERGGLGYSLPDRVYEITRELGRFADPLTARYAQAWQVQHLLRAGEGMLLIVPTERGTHILAFALGQPTRWYRSALTADQLRDLAREIRFHVGVDVAPSPEEFARWAEQPFARDAAHRLYAELVAPAAAHLEGVNHLYVVAGGPLEGLPFSLLVTAPPTGNGFSPDVLRATPWLTDRFAISRMPTVEAFLILKGEERIRRWDAAAGRLERRRPRFIGFADPVLAGDDVACGVDAIRGGALTRSMPRAFAPDAELTESVRRLPRLPCSGEEAALVGAEARARDRRIALRAEASEPVLQLTDLASASILLFATHALMPGELPGLAEPALVLTPPVMPPGTHPASEASTWVNDGLLTGGEIGDLRIAPDWLILSACNSGGGTGDATGNQAGGLTPWFFAAGANRILATNWPLLDAVAAALTTGAIRRAARERIGGAEALRQAMVTVRNDRSRDGTGTTSLAHPMVWAAFELFGDGALPAGR